MTDLELREKVAVRVMGWREHQPPEVGFISPSETGEPYGRYIHYSRKGITPYESEIAANEQMVRKMIDDGWVLTEQRTSSMYECKWRRGGIERKGLIVGALKHDDVIEVRARTALDAIESSND